MVCKRVFLSGKVQGVSFRFYAHEMATKLKLHGWIRNLNDGRVEMVISGALAAVDQMIAWAQKGPPRADVKNVEVHDAKETFKEPFFIRRDGG